jgi:Spy/CpxP family protein refolding chaperone
MNKYLGLALLAGTGLIGILGGQSAKAQELVLQPPPMERAFGGRMMHGRWWDDPKVAQQVGLTADQQKKMDDIFQQNRLKLIDLSAALQKQELIMQPLMESEQPDEGKILAQIDAVAQARAELEKNNARMLLGIRKVLTPDQWKKVKELPGERRVFVQRFHRDERGDDGPAPPPAPKGGPGEPGPAPQME